MAEEALEMKSSIAGNISPFVAGPPIMHPRYFFGRERELRRLSGFLKRAPLQSAAIIGPRRSGKTSLLLHLRNISTMPLNELRADQAVSWLPSFRDYRWVFVDFQDPRMGTREGVVHSLLGQLGVAVSISAGMEELLDRVATQVHSPTVIMLDEVGVALQRYPELDGSFWEGLRSLVGMNGNLAYIMASHLPPIELAYDSGHGSPFFNIFGYTSNLGPLSESEAHGLVASSPVPFSASDQDWIVATSGRWPMLMQILCCDDS